MSEPNVIPYLPANAPFTPEQRAYLNGFFAGLFSRGPAPAPAALAPKLLLPIAILFGSQTGNAETLAKRISKAAGQRGFAPTLHELSRYPLAQLASEERVLIVTSTFGDGEPPDNARAFWEQLNSESAPRLPNTRFSICALGDSNYPKFCGFGRELDLRFQALGARAVVPRVDCDVEFEEVFAQWLDAALAAMGESYTEPNTALPASTTVVVNPLATNGETTAVGGVPKPYSRSNPFPAALLTNRKLNAPGSAKETRHFEIALAGSGLTYEVGDALGVIPTNCPEMVRGLLAALGFNGEELVPAGAGSLPIAEALLRHFEITKIPPPFLKAMAERSRDPLLNKLIAPDINGELKQFLWGREIIDLLLAHPRVKFAPVEFVGLLKKLNPRLYSISSSPKAHPGQVHVTVNVVRYESFSRPRKGVCSTFLADRVSSDHPVPVFFHSNKNFRPPQNPDVPMIMVGPGTGIAPFRGFLHERAALGAKGKNWLFFGDQRSAKDFMYREELEALQRSGVLTKLDTAFSRDQVEKIYVQDRMREHATELFEWLADGAHFYVCGDAGRMAKDVDAALHEALQTGGGLTAEQAKEFVAKLKAQKRYQRDVY